MGAKERLSVAVLLGGTSAEHDVSVNSGLNVLDALDADRFDACGAYISPAGSWHFGYRPELPSLERDVAGDSGQSERGAAPDLPPSEDPFETFRSGRFDAVFVALHGPGGEDGKVQGLLSLAGVPFTGSGVLASALAMDKLLTKRLLEADGMPVADDAVVSRRDLQAEDFGSRLRDMAGRIGMPCVVKPVEGGSSFGTTIVRRGEDLVPALNSALSEDQHALVESYLTGTELTCGVLGGGAWEPATVLPVTEIVPVTDEFFDFRAKYTIGACDEITPARIDEAMTARVQELARLAHVGIGCEGMSRTDFILTERGPVMLEINTIPGMTRTSLLPQGAAAAGIGFDELVERLLRSALTRAERAWPWA